MTTQSLLSRVPWETINERVRREQRNREVYVPPISLFRWWARRPHALIGALIDAAAEPGSPLVVSDPFSGGGTVAMEAARRGLSIYAQDLHPWPAAGLAAVLDGVDADALEKASRSVLEDVKVRCGNLYHSPCGRHGECSIVSHVFWVRSKICPRCDLETFLFPYSLVSLASRSKDETHGYFGCRSCGSVSRHSLSTDAPRCPRCARVFPAPDEALLPNRQATCAHGRCGETIAAFDGSSPAWTAVLVQRQCGAGSTADTHFDPPPASLRSIAPSDIPSALNEVIGEGLEIALLRRAGFKRWADVFPPRQLRTIVDCTKAISALDATEPIRARLRLALCGASEMAGYLSRWDRYYPKAFEAVANHRFPALGLACETNLLAERGRGTLPKRFGHSVAAARWAQEHIMLSGAVRVVDSSARRRRVGRGAVVACGSSERQIPSDKSVDLVLTDPPYFDDVQYAELASLFLVSARAVGLLAKSVSLDLNAEAVANHVRGTGVEEYCKLLGAIFAEAKRTLKPGGRVVLTYHNTDIRAWWALARALTDAKLEIRALAVADAENGADHAKRGSNAFTCDLVIECQRMSRPRTTAVIIGKPSSDQARELLAAGQAMALAGASELVAFTEVFRSERGEIRTARIRFTPPERT